MNFWIVKSEPSTYSILDLKKDKVTVWDGIRNYQARNFLRQMVPGDQVVFYHSGEDKAIVGLASITRKAFQDPKTIEDWSAVELTFSEVFKTPLKLTNIKSDPALKNLIILKQSRLSVGPLTSDEFNRILNLTNGA